MNLESFPPSWIKHWHLEPENEFVPARHFRGMHYFWSHQLSYKISILKCLKMKWCLYQAKLVLALYVIRQNIDWNLYHANNTYQLFVATKRQNCLNQFPFSIRTWFYCMKNKFAITLMLTMNQIILFLLIKSQTFRNSVKKGSSLWWNFYEKP